MTDVSVFDRDRRFHEEWLGLAQPIEGLVFSVPVLIDAQIRPRISAQLTPQLEAHVVEGPTGPVMADLRRFFREFLGYSTPGMMVERADVDPSLSFYAPEGGQEIRPSFALARGPFTTPADEDPFAVFDTPTPSPEGAAPESSAPSTDAAPSARFWALVWDLQDDAQRSDHSGPLSLDQSEDATGPWKYPPTAKLERLLRHTGIPIGILSNGEDIRLLYAPPRESSAHLTFRLSTLRESAGRPVLAALQLLLNASRAHTAAPAHTLEGLLQESRRRQADVTRDLAQQVFEAVEILLEGFEHAAARDIQDLRQDWLRAALDEPGNHLYQGVLSVVLRLVFLLYAEDQSLLPVEHPLYAQHLSVFGLYEQLRTDSGSHPESMHHRFGAYGRLLALFRAVFVGVRHGSLELPARRGRLFDPASYPFLEGGLPGSSAAIVLAEQRAAVRPPSIDDGTLFRVLHRLISFQGQRLSYRTLDVEQIGSVYESLMGYEVLKTSSAAVRVGPLSVWVELDRLETLSPTDRKRQWKEVCGLNPGPAESIEQALKDAGSREDLRLEALSAHSPGRKTERTRHRVGRGRLVLQPGEERRRTGSHYTPRSLTEKIVQRTLEPVLACLGETPSADQLLQLKICDPAMGSGAFLVAACRHLADRVVAAWTAHGQLPAVAEVHADPHLHARRLVAQRCLYGVDKNPAAVELAKLSLWLVTLSRSLPFTFVDHALRQGDSLVGLDFDQLRAFHWRPEKQLDFCETVLADALEQAVGLRTEILTLADHEDAEAQAEKRRLLDFADQAMARMRRVADVCVGAFFGSSTDRERENERKRRMDLCRLWLQGEESLEPTIRGMAEEVRAAQTPFHWVLEFPEVFFEGRKDPLAKWRAHPGACMDAVVGNPPFLGGKQIAGLFGNGYRDWLLMIHQESHGNSDYCAHFFRRAAWMIGTHGCVGFIATNTIAQGDTRTSGLAYLLSAGFRILDAMVSFSWPGDAAVTVSSVVLANGQPSLAVQKSLLNDIVVSEISSRLLPQPERPDAQQLLINSGIASSGSFLCGQGFVLNSEDEKSIVSLGKHYSAVLFPFIGGLEVNSSPTQSPNRIVICFHGMSLEESSEWPYALEIVRERVKPERDQLRGENSSAGALRKNWWKYQAHRPDLYAALAPLPRCLVNSQVSKHLVFAFQPTDRIFAHTLYVFPLDSNTAFSILQSRIHEPWARLLCSSMKTDLRYSPSDCFETFPFPQPDPRTVLAGLEEVGGRLYAARALYMVETDQGLTKTYNALKDPGCAEGRILELRGLHEDLDRAVLLAYGWSDLEVPPFCPRTPSETAQVQRFSDAVIDRLYALNAQRAQAEKLAGEAAGKDAKKGAKKGKAGGKAGGKVGLGPLFGDG